MTEKSTSFIQMSKEEFEEAQASVKKVRTAVKKYEKYIKINHHQVEPSQQS
jgi:hypothetical protein